MVTLHDDILGDSWSVSSSIDNFFSTLSNDSMHLNSSQEISNSFEPDIEFKNFTCNSNFAKNDIIINATEGKLLSPNYPDNFDDGSDCRWDIKLPYGSRTILEFSSVDTEVHYRIY